jgi:hypothetical protein
MAQNFIACDREQVLLLAPSVRDWLPDDHLALFVIDAVAQLDLEAFYGSYRRDGHGRAAHDPSMMVALLLYAYARGQRSSRLIERDCVENVAYRVITANQARSRDDRAVRPAPRDGDRGLVWQRAWPLRARRDGEGRRDRDRRHEGACQRVTSRQP